MPVIKSENMKYAIFVFILSFLLLSGSWVLANPGHGAPDPHTHAATCTNYCDVLKTTPPANFFPPESKVCICNPLTTIKFTDVVDRILNILFFVAIAVAPIMILVAGFKFLTGGGNPETLQGARQMLIWTAVGFGIILLSKGIVFIVRGIVGF